MFESDVYSELLEDMEEDWLPYSRETFEYFIDEDDEDSRYESYLFAVLIAYGTNNLSTGIKDKLLNSGDSVKNACMIASSCIKDVSKETRNCAIKALETLLDRGYYTKDSEDGVIITSSIDAIKKSLSNKDSTKSVSRNTMVFGGDSDFSMCDLDGNPLSSCGKAFDLVNFMNYKGETSYIAMSDVDGYGSFYVLPFISDKPLDFSQFSGVRESISNIVECITLYGYGNDMESFLDSFEDDSRVDKSHSGGSLFAEKWDLSPMIRFLDKPEGLFLEMKSECVDGYITTLKLCLEKEAFLKSGKVSIIKSKSFYPESLPNKDVSKLIHFIKHIIDVAYKRHSGIEFECINIIPFSSNNANGVAHYIKSDFWDSELEDYTFSYGDGVPHCTYVVSLQ